MNDFGREVIILSRQIFCTVAVFFCNIANFKEAITTEIGSVSRQILNNVRDKFHRRILLCNN